jgi:hypothetical protein
VAAPFCPRIEVALGEAVRTAQQAAAAPPVAGADPPPRWTLKRLATFVQDRLGRLCCRESIRAALHRLDLSWKKARKLLGRADPARRTRFIAELRPLLDGAQRERHPLVYLDEAISIRMSIPAMAGACAAHPSMAPRPHRGCPPRFRSMVSISTTKPK